MFVFRYVWQIILAHVAYETTRVWNSEYVTEHNRFLPWVIARLW